MSRKNKTALGGLIGLLVVILTAVYLNSVNIPVLQPAGPIASQERRLIIIAVLLSLVVVIPVFVMLIGFAWHFREGNKKAKYSPEMDGSRVLESLWWGVPIILISILGVITWRSSHELDPFKSLSSPKAPVTIQVVALQWKWLFIYPSQGVASVNYLKMPVDTPVNFQITADAPMNSFWIPQLGGQIYAMPGMSTHLHLMADSQGTYRGSSANISGKGFAGMDFSAKSSSQADFDQWVALVHQTKNHLSLAEYNSLAKPSQNNALSYYSSSQSGLYDRIVMKYMMPASQLPYINSNSLHGGGM